MNTWFLTIDEVVEIHENQIITYGGSLGIRDEGLLRSAIAQPESTFGKDLLHPSLELQAAAYLFHIVKNHPFVDGNKRVGTVCMLVFLEINGFELSSALDEELPDGTTKLEKVVVDVIAGAISKEELANFIKVNIQPI
ncbi:MAG: type II toxin-antitoxin system death-on-curing family toxin [Bdellovibrio sp.]